MPNFPVLGLAATASSCNGAASEPRVVMRSAHLSSICSTRKLSRHATLKYYHGILCFSRKCWKIIDPIFFRSIENCLE